MGRIWLLLLRLQLVLRLQLLLRLVLVIAAAVVRLLLLVPRARVHCCALGLLLTAGGCLPVAWWGVGSLLLLVSPRRRCIHGRDRVDRRHSRASSSCGWQALLLWLHTLVLHRGLGSLPLPAATLCILRSRLLLLLLLQLLLLQLLLAALLCGCLHGQLLLQLLLLSLLQFLLLLLPQLMLLLTL